MKWLIALVAVVGALAVAAAIVYYTVPADSLPSVFGPLHGVKAHRTKRGEAALAVGIVLWVVAIIMFFVNGRIARRVTS